MKRYLLFVFQTHYPRGGFHDFVIDADDINVLKNKIVQIMDESDNYFDGYFEIVDITKRRKAKFHNFPYNMDKKYIESLDFLKLKWGKLT